MGSLLFQTHTCGCLGSCRIVPVPGGEYRIACPPGRLGPRAFICALTALGAVSKWRSNLGACTSPCSRAFIMAVTGGSMEEGPTRVHNQRTPVTMIHAS